MTSGIGRLNPVGRPPMEGAPSTISRDSGVRAGPQGRFTPMRPTLRRGVIALAAALAALTATALAAGPSDAARPGSGGGGGKTKPCGGVTLTKPDGTAWQCTFGDEFSGSSLDTAKWVPQLTSTSGYHVGPECFVNTPSNISVANGTLNLTVRKEAAPFTCSSPSGAYTSQYTSGMVTTYGKFGQAYGRFEVRAKLPAAAVAGLQESFWLWPVNWTKYGAYPYSGEIDIAEVFSNYADRAIPYIHYVPAATDYNVTNNYCYISDVSAFHTYAVEWTTSAITVVYDGKTCLVDEWNPASPLVKPQPFDSPFFLALTQALGIGGNAFDPATTPLPATTSIDYVRVWK